MYPEEKFPQCSKMQRWNRTTMHLNHHHLEESIRCIIMQSEKAGAKHQAAAKQPSSKQPSSKQPSSKQQSSKCKHIHRHTHTHTHTHTQFLKIYMHRHVVEGAPWRSMVPIFTKIILIAMKGQFARG